MRGNGPLRVLAFADYLSEDSCGGAERVTREVYKRLARADVEIQVLTASPFVHSGDGELDGISVRRVHAVDLSRLLGVQVSLAPRVIREALRLVDSFQPEVLHANSLHFQTSIAAALCQRRKGVPLVTTVHIASPGELRLPVAAATTTYERTVGRYILSRSSRVIAVSPSVAAHAKRLGVPDDRIAVVPNGVDQSIYAPRGVASSVQRIDGEDPLLVFVGRLIRNKGPHLLVNAVAHLRRDGVGVRAVFVGDGPMRADLERSVTAEGLTGAIHFAGQSDDVAGWLAKAAILVRPSFTEGFPLTVLEAMASGVLVVASKIPGNTDLLRDGRNGLLFAAGSAFDLACVLRLALSNPELSARLAEAGRESIQTYTWEACASATWQILAQAPLSALAGPARAGSA